MKTGTTRNSNIQKKSWLRDFSGASAGFCRLMTKLKNRTDRQRPKHYIGNICQILHYTCSCHKGFNLIFLDSFTLKTVNIIFQAIRAVEFPASQSIIVDKYYHCSNFCVI